MFIDLFSKIKKTYNWLIKIYQYSIFLWDDKDWDYVYIFMLLKFKLERMRKMFSSNKAYSDNTEVINDFIKAENLLDKLIKDTFLSDELIEHDEKWGELEIEFKPCETNSKFSEIIFKTQNAITDEEKQKESEDFRIAAKIAEKTKEATKKELFDFLNERIFFWWD